MIQERAATAIGEIRIVRYDESWRGAHERFAQRMWPGKRRRREERFIRWKFRGPSEGPVEGFLLAVSDGEILGQLGLIPVSLSLDGARRPCQWACDLMVDPSLRRMGVGTVLFDAALARGVVTLGSNPSSAADVAMQRIGFRPLIGPAIAVFPIDPSHVLSWKVPTRLGTLTPLLAGALRPLIRWRGRRLLGHTRPIETSVERGSWRAVAERIAERQAGQLDPFIVHDEEFLAWRCGGLSGFADPLQAIWTQGASYAIIGLGAPYFYVYDWHAPSWEEFLALFSEIRALSSAVHAMTVQAYANTAEERTWLRRAGFLLLRQPCKILSHPPARFVPRYPQMRYSIFDSDGNL